MTSTRHADTTAAPQDPQAARTYTWAGVDCPGVPHQGRTSLTPAQMAAKVECHYRRGWRELLVAEGWDPPAQAADLSAAIDLHPGTDERRWRAAVAPGHAPSLRAEPDPQTEAGS
jgi:hypothetical protein